LRIHGWIERENGKATEFFITLGGDYEVRSADVATLDASYALVKALAEAAKPFLEEVKPRISWD